MIKHYTQYSKEAQDEHNKRHQFKIEGLTWAAACFVWGFVFVVALG